MQEERFYKNTSGRGRLGDYREFECGAESGGFLGAGGGGAERGAGSASEGKL